MRIACMRSIWGMLLILLAAAQLSYAAEPGKAGEFFLGPGDTIDVAVWNDPALTRTLLVRPDGNISFPLLGDVAVAGRTVEQVRALLEERISRFVPDSPVTVILSSLGSTRIYVVGKVDSPGEFLLHGRTTVIQAIAMAGGLTTFADAGAISVLREQGGRMTAIPFNYEDVEAGKALDQNIALQPGDTIVVP